jgi:hypothetical protein
VGASTADALQDPSWWSGHSSDQQHTITDLVYTLGPQGVTPYTGAPADTASSVVNDLQSEPASAPGFGDLAAETTGTEESIGLIQKVTTALSRISAAGTAFTAGWVIGSGINADFLHIGLGSGTAPNGSNSDFCYSQSCGGELHWYPQGSEMYEGATVQQSPGAYVYWAKNNLDLSMYRPVRWFEQPCTFSGFTPPPGARLQTGVSAGVNCNVYGTLHPIYVDYPYVTEADLLRQGLLHRYNSDVDGSPDVTSPAPADPGTSTVEQALQNDLGSDGRDLLRAWLDWSLDPDHQAAEDPTLIGPPGQGVSSDDPCQPADLTAPQYLPVRQPGYTGTDSRAAVVHEFSGTDPTTQEPTTIHLYWGSIKDNWGFRHIVYKHGWGPTALAQTEAALQDPEPDPQYEGATSYRYHYEFTSGGTACQRTVVVEFGDDPADNFAPGPKHIITDFVGPVD